MENDLTQLCGVKSLSGHMCFCSSSSPWGFSNGVDSTQRCKEPSYRPPCRSRCVLSSLYFFFRSAVVVMISTLTDSLHMITTCCCLGTKWQIPSFFGVFWMWRIFHGNRPRWLWAEIISCCYWQLLDRRLLWPDFSFFTPTPMCAYCQIKTVVHHIDLVAGTCSDTLVWQLVGCDWRREYSHCIQIKWGAIAESPLTLSW